MTILNYLNFSQSEFLFVLFIVFVASIIRGFNGFGFSATCISGFAFIIPAIEIAVSYTHLTLPTILLV